MQINICRIEALTPHMEFAAENLLRVLNPKNAQEYHTGRNEPLSFVACNCSTTGANLFSMTGGNRSSKKLN